MAAHIRLPVQTGVGGSVHVGLDTGRDGRPLLWLSTAKHGDNLTVEQAEVLGRALLAWAADMRLVTT